MNETPSDPSGNSPGDTRLFCVSVDLAAQVLPVADADRVGQLPRMIGKLDIVLAVDPRMARLAAMGHGCRRSPCARARDASSRPSLQKRPVLDSVRRYN